MAHKFTYTTPPDPSPKTWDSSITDLESKNFVFDFDKRTAVASFEFDYRGPVWDPEDTPYFPNAWISSTYGQIPIIKLYPSSTWKRTRIEYKTYDFEPSLKKITSSTFNLYVRPQGNVTWKKVTVDDVEVDLDPVEYHLTILSPSSSSDSTPDIEFELKNLWKEQKMSPALYINEESEGTTVVTFEDDSTVSMESYFLNLNGVKFSESNVTMDNYWSGFGYFKKIKKYKITSPVLPEGEHTYTIDLKCTEVD